MAKTIFIIIGVAIAIFCKRYFFGDVTGLGGVGLAALLGGVGGGIGGGLGALLFSPRKDGNDTLGEK